MRLEVVESARVGDVMEIISNKLLGGDRNFEMVNTRTGVPLNPADGLQDVDLVDGDELELKRPGAYTPVAPPASSLLADVVAGPNLGASYVLNPGNWVLGRAGDCAITVPDPNVHWHHAQLQVSSGGEVTVTPSEPDFPVLRNGEQMQGPFLLNSDDTLQVGQTSFVIRSVAVGEDARDAFGHIEFNRIPYVRTVPEEIKMGPVPAPPDRPTPNPWRWAAILAPLVMGVAMVFIMGNIRFAMFAFLSPVMAVGNWIENKVGSKKQRVNSEQEWKERLDELEAALGDALVAERGQRLRASPSVKECARRARTRQTRLWERGREDGDFMHVRVGLGDVKSVINLEWSNSDDSRMDETRERFAPYETCSDVPVIVECAKDGVVGVYGPREEADGLANSLLIQILTTHSPEEIVMAAILGDPPGDYEWLKWVPHLRSAASPLPGSQLALGAEAGNDLLMRLLGILNNDTSKDGKLSGAHLLLFIHEDAGVDRAALSSVLEACGGAEVTVLWAGVKESKLPRQCKSIIRLVSGGRSGVVRHTDPEVADQAFRPEVFPTADAEAAARTLAPLRDVTAVGGSNSLPRVVTLDSVMGQPHRDIVYENWKGGREDPSLHFPLGMEADGPLMLDLVEDGPHTLIAGTSGAGKSELLQSMVVGLASRYAPDRLTFLFIDYKGGAAFAPFEELPHAVGFVTDLDNAGSLRALTSLRAEIRRREGMLEGRARDLPELRKVAPEVAPPSLVIVVDEFATLVREIPDFVTGMIDVAQRGRSLGVHLVLATQRPTGVVSDNILANTNLRMSLRVVDSADSMSILGDRDAADIPAPLKGRALVRSGTSNKVMFQTAWGGAVPQESGSEVFVHVEPFTIAAPSAGGASVRAGVRGGTQLDLWVDAIKDAFALTKMPLPRRPWLEPLPETLDIIPITKALATKPGPHQVVMGMIDDPSRQIQEPLVVNLEESGGALCFGSGGVGKTTWLRTIAFEQCRLHDSKALSLWVLDFASRGLGGVEKLPQCAAVVNGDNLDAVTRTVVWLEEEMERRRRILAETKAPTWSAARSKDPTLGPHHLVMVDGFGGYTATMEPFGFGVWAEKLVGIITEGRQVGIHALLTADRRTGVPAKLISSVEMRIVLRLNERDDLAMLEIDHKAVPEEQPPGRGMLRGNVVAQVAVPGTNGEHENQEKALEVLALRLQDMEKAQTYRKWPDVPTPLPLKAGEKVDLGWDEWGDVLSFNVGDGGLLVCGGGGSGKTTMVKRLAAGQTNVKRVLLAGLRGPLVGDSMFDEQAVGQADVGTLVQRLYNDFTVKGADSDDLRLVIVADDADVLLEGSVANSLEELAKLPGVSLIAACDAYGASRAFSGWASLLKRSRRMALLNPDMVGDEEVLGVRLKLRPGVDFRPGRGLLMEGSSPRLVQVALL